ncbi:tripartite ATP-independent transporter solute receptor, DctP family [Paracoccus thiocyanatus]|uniref:Tripartite ATP-independent transporter solute receptor, DctP family n=1 Tax=Paracoccus thiocyanatus TaxID=34006 RepID=A0A1N6WKR3_9RHOB|nr:TRAP transporter substrate-binding protein [Paracoccus thiocyanatus]SIQ90566.1 tripartite ATP-independent transporter solute receptor, DctP family [Paracoccus thiocyanatus]
MITLNRRRFAALAVACMTAASAMGASAAELTLKLGHLANEQNSWHKASLKFAEELDRLTEGRIAVEVFPNDSLGREMDLINGMQLGTVEMTITGESLQNWAPMAALLAIPYAYQSLEHMDQVAGGEIGKEIEAQVIERAQVRPIGYFARGPRNLTANRAITTPAELQRMRLRVPNVPLFVDAWTALGAQPTPMAFSEVFTSLQNGTIDGQENPLALIQTASLNEVQSHVNQTEHVRSWIYLTIAEQVWQNLSAEDQAHVQEAARIAQEFERQQFLQDEDAIRADLEAKGMTFVEVDQKAFADGSRDAVIKSVDESIRPIVEDLFNH